MPLIIHVALGRRIALGSLRYRFSNAPYAVPIAGFSKFQVTHVGYGETWKEKGVVKSYSIKCTRCRVELLHYFTDLK